MAGFTIGAVDIAAGSAAAAAAKKGASELIKEHPKSFMMESGWVLPGTKYFEVVGGPHDGKMDDLQINEISPGQFATYGVKDIKLCTAMSSSGYVEEPAFSIDECGDARLKGPWRQVGFHHDRPQYSLASGNDEFVIEYSNKHQAWRVTTAHKFLSHNRASFYESKENTGIVPTTGWTAVTAGVPAPTVTFSKPSHETASLVV